MKILAAAAAFLVLAGSATAGTVVKTAYNAKLKRTILVDARGMTLYMFAADYKKVTACIDDATYHCSKHWPPLLTTGGPAARGAAKRALLGTATRPDGTKQVTYAGHLLYTYRAAYGGSADRRPGDVNGQGFASSWYALSPTGKPITR